MRTLTRPGTRGQKRLRFVPRRLRYLQRWSDGFAGNFPGDAELAENPRYWNEKIPVDSRMVSPPYTNALLQRECAQRLIDACHHLMLARPASVTHTRVTCCIALPDMFASELCIYRDEDYFQGHTAPAAHANGTVTVLKGRSLATDWGLTLHPGMQEHGVHVLYPETETTWSLDLIQWYYGEVGRSAPR